MPKINEITVNSQKLYDLITLNFIAFVAGEDITYNHKVKMVSVKTDGYIEIKRTVYQKIGKSIINFDHEKAIENKENLKNFSYGLTKTTFLKPVEINIKNQAKSNKKIPTITMIIDTLNKAGESSRFSNEERINRKNQGIGMPEERVKAINSLIERNIISNSGGELTLNEKILEVINNIPVYLRDNSSIANIYRIIHAESNDNSKSILNKAVYQLRKYSDFTVKAYKNEISVDYGKIISQGNCTCGGKYIDNYGYISCSKCYFKLYKSHLGITLSEETINDLISGKTTERIDGFKSKKGPISAALKYNRDNNKLEMIFK